MTNEKSGKEVTPDQIAFALGGIGLATGGARLLLGYIGHRIYLRIAGAAADAPAGRTKGDPQ